MRHDNANDSWEPCQPGTLSRLSSRVARRQATRQLLTIAGAVAGGTACVLLLLSGLGVGGLGVGGLGVGEAGSVTPARGFPGGVAGVGSSRAGLAYTCRDAIDNRDSFLLGSAAPEIQASVREHLGHCPPCQAAYRQRAQELQVEYTVLVSPAGPNSAYAAR